MEWYYRQMHSDYRPLPPLRSDCNAADVKSDVLVMSLVYPDGGNQIYVPVELDGKLGRVVFEATHRDRSIRLFWHLDQDFLGTTREIHTMSLAPKPGRHKLTLVDENGEQLIKWFEIIPSRADRS